MKYRILKFLDVAGLGFLSPLVRLCTGEEPRKQWREIGRLLVVPVVAFALFLFLWNAIAPRHRTKSGEVPTPGVVWDAAKNIWVFHVREGNKERAYAQSGEDRSRQLATVQARQQQILPLVDQSREAVARAEQQRSARIQQELEGLETRRQELQQQLELERAARETGLAATADQLPVGDVAARNKFLAACREHDALSLAGEERLQQLGGEETRIRSQPDPDVAAALKFQTKVAEEQQYLAKLAEQLDAANRDARVSSQLAQLRNDQAVFLSATGGEVLPQAQQLIAQEKRIRRVADSAYAKPLTLPLQIVRSVVCVFVGFLLGSAIAIPLGVLCGLSPICMSALTPFVALFKPVSPIVWLPIALIIVGGFIPDPDKHWLVAALANLPLIGWMKINPAFIASAVTVALCSLWATLVNTALGVASIEKDHLNVARVLRLGTWAKLTKIVIPSALPLIFAGLRISLGVGWMVLIAAELLSSSEGIGKFVWDQFNNGASDSFAKMMVVVFVVGVIGWLLDRIMVVLQRLVSFDVAGAM